MIYTLLSEFRLPWPPSCCLYQPTPFVGSSSRIASPALFYYFANPPILPSLLSLLSRALAVYTKKSASRTRALVRPTRGQGQSQGRGQREGRDKARVGDNARAGTQQGKTNRHEFKKFLLTQKRAFYRARKSMYDVHQTCVRGSSNLCTWFFFRPKLQQESRR